MNDLRKTFFDTMLELAKKDKDIIILLGDLGYPFTDKFMAELPEQIINCGIAETNMIGVACGLALAGKKPYCYSNSIFLIMRTYEFIRDDVCYNNLDVKLIGTKSGGFLGFTHNLEGKENMEDLLKNLPNLVSIYPKDNKELKSYLKVVNPYPTFIQL